jgi:ABC-2 type transport system ATP-binding protein
VPVRTLEIEFAAPPPAAAFAGVDGVRDIGLDGVTLRCTVVGSMDPILKAAARHEVRTLSSVEPSLEDVFLAYYGEGTSHAA